MDTDIIPLGERAQRSILDHILVVGDEAETGYLEVKSELDLASTEGVAKVAKFLLGAANRRPKDAARYFRGYAVLVIGAQKGHAKGIDRGIEAHELEDRLRPYLGPEFPAFEFGRITVNSNREVLFVVAQPPHEGQAIFPCHKSFQGAKGQVSLEDGAIYVRGASNTRPARAGEVLALVERSRGVGKPPISLEIEVLGSINRVGRLDEVLERLYDLEEQHFPKPQPASIESSSLGLLTPSILGNSRPASAKDRIKSLENWRREKPANVRNGRAYLLGVVLPGAGLRVVSHDRFVAKPHLIVTFHDCEPFIYRDGSAADFSKVVEPVVRKSNPFGMAFDSSNLGVLRRDHHVSWSQRDNDVEVVLTPESFRPNVPWTSYQDDYVLLTRDPQSSAVSVSWILTEDGNDATTTGEMEITPSELVDVFDLVQATFFDNS
ncbi:hypothetical protein B5P43_15725 [Bacillus sp. SRB_336]|nr:hypothetical protein B5P43_15725 [Bacillus sp. SRB_336]